jgi:ribosomal protein S18 acetylase RimI-like enzyme
VSTPTIREATAADARSAAQLLHDFNTEFGEPSPGVAALTTRLEELLSSGEATVLLGGEGPEGILAMRFSPSLWSATLEAYIAELYVVPDRRGQGLGQALLEAAIELARGRDTSYIHLGTSTDDVAARGLYAKLGFTNREGGPDGPVMLVYELEL